MQNELRRFLPAQFAQQFPQGTDIAFAVIPIIPTLPEDLQFSIRVAFSQSMRLMWIFAAGFTGIALIAGLFMKALPLHTQTDRNWGIREDQSVGSNEKA